MDKHSTVERGVAGVKLWGPGLEGARENFAIENNIQKAVCWKFIR